MPLEKWAESLALRLQETLSHSDISKTLSDALTDLYPNNYCYPTDIFGNDSSGLVVYCLGSDFKQAMYTITSTDGKRACTIATSTAVDVLPRTVYDLSADAIKEAGARHSKGDMAKLQTIHDHTIALGASCPTVEAADVEITGDVIPLKEGAVGQDGTAYLKLISPGWGSSGFYSSDLLKRDGPKVFPAGTKNFWDHQTAAEESARPEGSLRDLASVLTEDAHYEETGTAGPGLYAKAKVFEQFRQPVDDLAKHIGMSIRAAGRAKEGKAEGKSGPIIEQLTKGLSVDYVTTPGAGGQILQLFEAARGRAIQQEGEIDMDETALKRLIESAVSAAVVPLQAEVKSLREELDKPKPAEAIRRLLEGIKMPDAAKQRIVVLLQNSVPLTESKQIDEAKLKPMVEAAAADEAKYLEAMGVGRIQGLGSAAPPEIPTVKPEELLKESENVFGRLLGNEAAGKAAARGRAA